MPRRISDSNLENKTPSLKLDEFEYLIILQDECKVPVYPIHRGELFHLIDLFENSTSVEVLQNPNQNNSIEIILRFIDFILKENEEKEIAYFSEIFKLIFDYLNIEYITEDIHVSVQKIEDYEIQKYMMNTYYRASSYFGNSDGGVVDVVIQKKKSYLLESGRLGKSKIMGIFGGQGVSENYFDELQDMYQTYGPFILKFLEEMSNTLKDTQKKFSKMIFFKHNFDLLDWILDDKSRPDQQYLNQSFISFPIIGLIQILNVYIVLKTLNMSPKRLSECFNCLSGHSQGVLTAYVLSISPNIESFKKNSLIELAILFTIGAKSHMDFPSKNISNVIVKDSLENGEGNPAHMLLVSGITNEQMENKLDYVNSHFDGYTRLEISIINSRDSFVISGPPQNLHSLCKNLRYLKPSVGSDQARIPFSKRNMNVNCQFLQVSEPFHSNYMNKTAFGIMELLRKYDFKFQKSHMAVPIKSFSTGLFLDSSENALNYIVNSICFQKGDWIKATNVDALTHLVDFGPGGFSGIGSLTEKNKEGSGVYIIFAGENKKKFDSYSGSKFEIFDSRIDNIKYLKSWAEEYGPKLVRLNNNSNGEDRDKLYLDTKFSRLLGKPPLMVAGMTPSTVHPEFVSAVLNAGYHIELAGGGYYNEKSLRDSINRIKGSIDPGNAVTLNIIFLNVRMASFQIPLIQVMRSEGSPIDGVCISAGVPTLETCSDLISGLISVGIRHISFKPGSTSAIRQVIRIAKENKDMNIILQWTGGRGGGHHSFEDFHQPIVDTYSEIRSHANIILVAGSGFGGSKDTIPYLMGDWSLKFGRSKMPYDGILLGSRMMVAKECPTSYEVKKIIVDTPGVADEEWEKTYDGAAGGVISVISELGQPVHVIANRAAILWREFDDTLFSLPKDQMFSELQKKKDYIISRINEDYQKPYFGRSKDGSILDLEDMTYSEVVNRLIQLFYLNKIHKWVDPTYKEILGDFLTRIEERFSDKSHEPILKSLSQLENPFEISEKILLRYSKSFDQVLIVEDVHHFLQICSKAGRKPVNFIPILDKDFESWFKKDSLWQSEFIESVLNEDVGRIIILQGPVSVSYSTEVNVPSKVILDEINNSYIEYVLNKRYKGDVKEVPQIEYLYEFGNITVNKDSSKVVKKAGEEFLEIKTQKDEMELPSYSEWINIISRGQKSWLTSLYESNTIVREGSLCNNNLKSLLMPRINQTVIINYYDDMKPQRISISTCKDYEDVVLLYNENKKMIKITLNYLRRSEVVGLDFLFYYRPDMPFAMISEISEGRNARIGQFYKKIWIEDISKLHLEEYPQRSAFKNNISVTKEELSRFCQIIENNLLEYSNKRINEPSIIPLDYLFALAWDSMCLVSIDGVNASVLDVVHYSNKFEILQEGITLNTNDIINVKSRLVSVKNKDNGVFVSVEGIILKGSSPYCKITTVSMYRGKSNDFNNSFEEIENDPMEICISSDKILSIILSKEWLNIDDSSIGSIKVGSKLIFKLKSFYKFKNELKYSSVKVEGIIESPAVNRSYVTVGKVEYMSGSSYGNPVIEFLNRFGKRFNDPSYFEDGGYNIIPISEQRMAFSQTHLSNLDYSLSSGDLNPIHTNKYFSDFCGLPATIVHGMWTSANTRKVLEIFAAESKPERVVFYETNFLDMVIPGEKLETHLTHIGMTEGKKIIKIQVFKCKDNTKVLEGTAHVIPPKTVYVFTGQGSQVKGMGMELYGKSDTAKKIWDDADSHMFNKYGFSLLEILNSNIKQKTIYFGGENGSKIRSNYMSLKYEEISTDGEKKLVPLFPDINQDTQSHTFISADCLMNSTEFTQPLIMIYEIAAFQDMVDNNLVYNDIMFAGHSLGEFCALSALGRIMKTEDMVELIFYRGLAMQKIVKRSADGSSNYGMVAFNPSRCLKGLEFSFFNDLIKVIGSLGFGLIETVNYNTENWQYVIAGELRLLKVFGLITDFLSLNKSHLRLMISNYESSLNSGKNVEGVFNEITKKYLQISEEKNQYDDFSRSICTIKLPGIDVPFHSSYLNPGVSFIRTISYSSFDEKDLPVDFLEGRYIPNIVGKPFELSKEYFQLVYLHTGSQIIKKEIEQWNSYNLKLIKTRKRLGYIFMIEMLSYQFANPVQWISTQDELFKKFSFERFIEVGPTSVLCGMAKKTELLKYSDYDNFNNIQREFFCISGDQDEIYYKSRNQINDLEVSELSENNNLQTSVSSEDKASTITEYSGDSSFNEINMAPMLENEAEDISDVDIPISLIIVPIVAKKVKKKFSDVPQNKSIKEIVNGKSALQNEIVGDIQKEIPSLMIDRLEEMPLNEIFETSVKSVSKLGSYSSIAVSRLITSKMPMGLTLPNVKNFLKKSCGLGTLRSDSLLFLGTTMEPETRISSESLAHQWLMEVSGEYSRITGIKFNRKSSKAKQNLNSNAVVINSEEFEKEKKRNSDFLFSQFKVLAEFLDIDISKAKSKIQREIEDLNESLQKSLDILTKEHGDVYLDGVKPIFEKNKIRIYDSYWNWAHHDEEELFYNLLHGKYINEEKSLSFKTTSMANRSSKRLVDSLKYKYGCILTNSLKTCSYNPDHYEHIKSKMEEIITKCEVEMDKNPRYYGVYEYLGPKTEINGRGEIKYSEAPRKDINEILDFIKSMVKGYKLEDDARINTKQPEIILEDLKESIPDNNQNKNFKQYSEIINSMFESNRLPYLNLRQRNGMGINWTYNKDYTLNYLSCLMDISKNGLTFSKKKVLITGVGGKSIGMEILKALLVGGAEVVATTSRFNYENTKVYQNIYKKYGSKGSKLILFPFNQGSQGDINNLIDNIYEDTKKGGLGWDLDIIIPFGGISANGRDISEFDSLAELSHRIMMTNLIRIIGKVAHNKSIRNIISRPAQVILPLSLNHGGFGGDGMYPESKIGIMTLFDRWYSESWKDYINITGSIIGWSRGTSLMQQNNVLAMEMEKTGARTFSATETAFCIIGLMHPIIRSMNDLNPIYADISGGFGYVTNFSDLVSEIRQNLQEISETKKEITAEISFDFNCVEGDDTERLYKIDEIIPKSLIKLDFPRLLDYKDLSDKHYMFNMLNLDKTVVVTGFGEVGSHGNAETRWEFEAFGELSIKGCIMLGWIMGFIKYFNGKLKNGQDYAGWIDCITKEPVEDKKIKILYEKKIIADSGVRIIDPSLNRGYDPFKKMYIREALIERDMPPIVTSKDEAKSFKLINDEKVNIWENKDKTWSVQFLEGSSLYVPKATVFDVIVGSQIPKGFSPERYGFSESLVKNLDRISIMVLISVCDALMRAGIDDPYEFYKFIHLSELGNSEGSAVGGSHSTSELIKDRMLGYELRDRVLLESLVTTPSAYTNMLLFSSSGPSKVSSGTCATGAISIDLAMESILTGDAKVMVTGGHDDLAEESGFEFYSMKATVNTTMEIENGRDPHEMSRPFSSTRHGFMDSAGAGSAIIMTASLALEMGLPIYGIIAYTGSASDKVGRSFPAPGKGLLTSASEKLGSFKHPLLDFNFRKRQLDRRRKEINRNLDFELIKLSSIPNGYDIIESIKSMKNKYGNSYTKKFLEKSPKDFLERPDLLSRLKQVFTESVKYEKEALDHWNGQIYLSNVNISSLRGSLAVYNLTVDEIDLLSCHGTSTIANDQNEASIISKQFDILGRSKGNICPAVSQKSVIGHTKGGAASMALNGVLQSIMTGIIPGNLSADNISQEFEEFGFIFNPSSCIKKDYIHSALIKSLGFGQVGGEVLVVNPDYLFASIPEGVYDEYRSKVKNRMIKSEKILYNTLTDSKKHFNQKKSPPYNPEDRESILLNPDSRAKYDRISNEYKF
ncbi:Fatty acid synthase subunit beta [Smittium mucronatum]|uniref:Fatty acid synthase subunit beta n=1 Tax=Smittium mucronatum TaxID=133383 RepID=A0A1R0GYA8_9FUNG|nr:Fatty acid synthase subunit beta [Smittium mucronatum]